MKYLLVGTGGKELETELELIKAVNSASSTGIWGEVENDNGDTIITYGDNYSFRVGGNPLSEARLFLGEISAVNCDTNKSIFEGRFELKSNAGGWRHFVYFYGDKKYELVSSRSSGSFKSYVKDYEIESKIMNDVVKFCAHKLL